MEKLPPVWLDKMDSYWLSETLKYLYLLFDDDSKLPLDQFVLTTKVRRSQHRHMTHSLTARLSGSCLARLPSSCPHELRTSMNVMKCHQQEHGLLLFHLVLLFILLFFLLVPVHVLVFAGSSFVLGSDRGCSWSVRLRDTATHKS